MRLTILIVTLVLVGCKTLLTSSLTRATSTAGTQTVASAVAFVGSGPLVTLAADNPAGAK